MIQKLIELMTKLGLKRGHDKVLHAIVGFIIGAVASYLLSNSILPLVLVILAAVAKEAWDEYSYGGADFFDLFATLLGGVAGIMLVGLLRIFI